MTQKQDFFTIMGGRVKFQRGNYAVTGDPVWLAAWAACENIPKSILDVGIGTGGASLCLAFHRPKYKITGIDTDDNMLSDCDANAKLNGRNFELIKANIFSWRTERTFDIVMTNPPFFKGTPKSISKSDAIPHHNTDLYEWTKQCLKRVRPRGRFFCITNAHEADKIIAALHNGHAGEIAILPCFGTKNTAERVLISARLGVKGGAIIYKAMSMNDQKILKNGKTIQESIKSDK